MPTERTSNASGNRVLADDQLHDLLRPGKEFETKLGAAIAQLAPGSMTLFLLNVKDYSSAPRAILQYYQSQKIPGTYVTVNKPYANLLKDISPLPENVEYVDAITALTGKDTQDAPHITYLDSPLALVELNLAIAEKLNGIVSNQKFLVLDSISTLLVYNSPQSVEKFCHTIIAKNRSDKTIGIFLMIESEEHHDVVETLGQFVDSVQTLH